jgi:hypothetical protein
MRDEWVGPEVVGTAAQAERKVARVGLMTFFSTVYSSCREELYCITGHE